MGAYNFHPQFEPFVTEGSKRQTIRARRRNPDKPGSTFHGYVGMRTKSCRKIMEAPIISIEELAMYRAQVWVNGVELSLDEKNVLAWCDGFHGPQSGYLVLGNRIVPEDWCVKGCFDLMLEFWVAKHGDIDFRGAKINWDFERRIGGQS